jgi:hypothetical protein
MRRRRTALTSLPETHMTRHRAIALAPVLIALISIGCLGTLQRSPDAAGIAESAGAALPLPVRESQPHWFLRQQDGWEAAHRTRYGGEGDDEGFTIIRVALFTGVQTASAAFARMTPQYAYTLWPSRMASVPYPVTFPVTIPGDEVSITEYPLLISPGEPQPEEELIVQLITIRSGRTVIGIESIGVPREDLAPVANLLVGAARRFEGSAP